MRKSEAKKLVAQMRDYVPGGSEVVNLAKVVFRPTREHEIHLCGAVTGRDLQSGSYYCGAVADWVALTGDEVAAVCDRHAKRFCIRREGHGLR